MPVHGRVDSVCNTHTHGGISWNFNQGIICTSLSLSVSLDCIIEVAKQTYPGPISSRFGIPSSRVSLILMGRWWFRDLCGDLAGDVGQSFSSILASWKLHEEAQKLMDYVLIWKKMKDIYILLHTWYLFFVILSLLTSMCLVLGGQCWGICHAVSTWSSGGWISSPRRWAPMAMPCVAVPREFSNCFKKKVRRRVCCLQMLGRGVRMFTRPTRSLGVMPVRKQIKTHIKKHSKPMTATNLIDIWHFSCMARPGLAYYAASPCAAVNAWTWFWFWM